MSNRQDKKRKIKALAGLVEEPPKVFVLAKCHYRSRGINPTQEIYNFH
jgi:hypothetical protein